MPVALHGDQDEAYFDGHYGYIAYLPIFVAVNGVPCFVQSAPGAANGAALCLIHIRQASAKAQEGVPRCAHSCARRYRLQQCGTH